MRVKAIYQRAYDALMERLREKDAATYDGVLKGTVKLREAVYYIRWALTTTATKPFLDNSTNRTVGQTNFDKGTFPYKAAMAFSHAYFGYYAHATDAGVTGARYSNLLYDPTVAGTDTVSSVVYQVEKNRIDSDLLNAELSFKIGDQQMFDRKPVDTFLKQARYQSDVTAQGGVGNVENAIELLYPITNTDNHTPELEILFSSGASIANYCYAEWRLFGLEVAVK